MVLEYINKMYNGQIKINRIFIGSNIYLLGSFETPSLSMLGYTVKSCQTVVLGTIECLKLLCT